jgi:hypothetical protein
VLHGIRRSIGLEALVREHLIKKAKAGRVTSETLEEAELYLTRAAGYFGRERDLASVTVGEVQRWVEHLRPLPSKQGTPGLSGGTLRHHLNHVSNLFRRAQSEGLVAPGYNPVAAIMPGEKPSGRGRKKPGGSK